MVLILVTEPQLLGLNLKGMDVGCHDLIMQPGKVVLVEWQLPMAPLLSGTHIFPPSAFPTYFNDFFLYDRYVGHTKKFIKKKMISICDLLLVNKIRRCKG